MTSHDADGRRLYVGNLSFELTERELRDVFAAHVGVEHIDWIKDKGTGVFRGFAFVTLMSEADVTVAVENLDGLELHGRKIRVSLAKPRENRRRN